MAGSQCLCADTHKEFVIETTGNGAGIFPQWFDGRGLAKDQAPSLAARGETQDGLLLLVTIDLNHHELAPCFSIVRLLASPCEVLFGDVR
jgi:hypothetical protein